MAGGVWGGGVLGGVFHLLASIPILQPTKHLAKIADPSRRRCRTLNISVDHTRSASGAGSGVRVYSVFICGAYSEHGDIRTRLGSVP